MYAQWEEAHLLGTDLNSNTENHWRSCTVCGEQTDREAHIFVWVTDKNATAAEAGLKHEECSICGYRKTAVAIPATGVPAQPENTSATADQSPQTGDRNTLGMYILLMMLAAGGIAAVLLYGKKRAAYQSRTKR